MESREETMSRSRKGLGIAAALAAGAASVAAVAQETRTTQESRATLLGPMADVLENRVGSWDVTARLQLTPSARPITIAAIAENRIVGGRWLVSEMRSADTMNGFHGIGVNAFDAQSGRYNGYWIDGSRGFTVPVTGRYDPATRTFRTTSIERRPDGRSITVVSETVTMDPDREETTFTAPDARGRPYVRMRLTFSRRRTP